MFTVFHILCNSANGAKVIAEDFEKSPFSNYNPELIDDNRISLDISSEEITVEHFNEISVFLDDLDKRIDYLNSLGEIEFSLDIAIEPTDIKNRNLFEMPIPQNVLKIISRLNVQLMITIYPPTLT